MRKIVYLFCSVLLFAACSDFLKEYSQGLAKVEGYEDLDEVLFGEAYLPVKTVYGDGSNVFFQTAHYMSDELTVYSENGVGIPYGRLEQMFGWHTWQQNVGLQPEGNAWVAENKDWEQAYHSINVCNMVISLIDEQPADNRKQELEKTRIKGEAYFLRALYYFTLVNLYGQPYCAQNLSTPGVPLKLTEYVEDKEFANNTVEEVYRQVLEDLDEAESCLGQAPVKNHPFRADITAAWLLKSRVYLYMQQWKDALSYAEKVLEKKKELLDLRTYEPDTVEVFTKEGPETIFSMGGHMLSTSIYYPGQFGTDYPIYIISDEQLKAFGDEEERENDLRVGCYIKEEKFGAYGVYNSKAWFLGKEYHKSRSYKTSDNFLFRTAEAWLNAAEAAAYLGDEATARTCLKTLRDHRLLVSGELAESGKELVELIRRERQRELCLEGHRWYDLRRYTVCEKYPEVKEIVHYYIKFSQSWGNQVPIEKKEYKLKTDDAGNTLSLPKEVTEFQNTLQGNKRPERPGTSVSVN